MEPANWQKIGDSCNDVHMGRLQFANLALNFEVETKTLRSRWKCPERQATILASRPVWRRGLNIIIGARCVRYNDSSHYCHDIRPSVCLLGTGAHCYHTVHFSVDSSSWLDSPMSWAPWSQSMSTYSQPSFSSSTGKKGGVWMCKLGVMSQERLMIEVKLRLSANRKPYMPRRLAQQRMTLSDLKWAFHASRAISAVAELLVCIWIWSIHVTQKGNSVHIGEA